MSDIEALVDQFNAKFEVSREDEEKLILSSTPSPASQTASPPITSVVGVSPVSTFVAEKSFHNFAVPHFGTHWGVVCDFEDEVRMLFYLLYNPSTRKMSLDPGRWKPEWSKHTVTHVGTTPYSFTKVINIG
jgi:hypothetical protein